jgi:hypothetical protein
MCRKSAHGPGANGTALKKDTPEQLREPDYSSLPDWVQVVRTADQGWLGEALSAVLERDDLIVVTPGRHVRICAAWFHPRRSALAQLKRFLREAGITMPRGLVR